MELPSFTQSSTDIVDPRDPIPNKLKLEPTRLKLRNDRAEPKWTTSKVDTELPNLPKPYAEQVEPKRPNVLRDSAEPIEV
jgi:hypothetical protein